VRGSDGPGNGQVRGRWRDEQLERRAATCDGDSVGGCTVWC
jgi:hypothetical protein